VLLDALRRIGLRHTQFAQASCGAIRLKLLKIGAQVRKSVRRIKVAMALPARTGLSTSSLISTRSAPPPSERSSYRHRPHRGPPPHAQNSTPTSTSRREQPCRAPGIPFRPSNRRRAHPL
jgi:hypothetical protein